MPTPFTSDFVGQPSIPFRNSISQSPLRSCPCPVTNPIICYYLALPQTLLFLLSLSGIDLHRSARFLCLPKFSMLHQPLCHYCCLFLPLQQSFNQIANMGSAQQTVLITGANRGIGLNLCKEFIERKYAVFGSVRHESRDDPSVAEVKPILLIYLYSF